LAETRLLSELVGRQLLWRATRANRPVSSRLQDLATACRRVADPGARRRLAAAIAPWLEPPRAEAWRQHRVGWDRYYRDFGLDSPELTTSLLLKEPGPDGEKGVLYVSFEYNLMRLLAHSDARRLLADYVVVGASSWSPTDYAVMANFAGLSDDPLFLGISNLADVEAYQVMEPAVRAVPIMACDWIDPSYYTPRSRAEREIDILMVANFSRFKRHWLLFEALRRMRRDLRITLVGIAAPGRTADDLRAEARAFGVVQELEIVTNASIDVVTQYQCNARIGLIFSRREGSCVAPAECFFGGTPVGMMRDAHVGSRAYINDATGELFERAGLARSLEAFLERSDGYRPREWAMDNISCHRSSARLNAMLREHSISAGRPWTRDIAPLCWRYVPTYVNAEDEARLAPAVAKLRERHGVIFKKFVYRPS